MRLNRKYRSWSDRLFDIFNFSLSLFLAIVFIYPFWQTLVTSVSLPAYANGLNYRLFPRGGATLAAYGEVLKNRTVFIAYGNTLYRAAFGTVITVIITYCGAYMLTKKRLPFRNTITFLIVFTMFFNGGLIPRYVLVSSLGLIGSRWALILPVATSAWNVIIARNFIAAIPTSMEESAIIDGAKPFQVVFQIIMPLSLPILAVLALWTAVNHWNAWFDALIYVRSTSKIVLQLYLRRILIDIDNQEVGFYDNVMLLTKSYTTPETVKAATIVVSTLPIICFYPFLQRYFVKGVMVGALKG